jgi:hypothetical protein
MKVFRFYVQSEQENGDEIGNGNGGVDGQKLELILPDGFDLKRVDTTGTEEYLYTVTMNDHDFFQFTILPGAVIPPPLGPLPSPVILREKGDTHEGTLE